MKRTVTEQDFRAPEFVGKDVADYEFRPDGKLVRTDRWEMGMRAVAQVLGIESREGFEIDDVVRQVAELVAVQPVVMPAPVGVPEGMNEWRGGECPVQLASRVDIMFRNGDTMEVVAGNYVWSHGLNTHNIVAYRLTEVAPVATDDSWID